MTTLSNIYVSSQWKEINIDNISGTVIVIGKSDTGKSTLIRWLVNILCQNKKIGWLDGDIGQTSLGVPATMNLAVIDNVLNELPCPQTSFFVGAVTPSGNMLPTLVGVQRLREQAFKKGVNVLVMDTTGLVAKKAGGGALLQCKIELLQPKTIIALQRKQELEHVLAPLRRDRNLKLYVLPPVEAVKCRSPEKRKERRTKLFRNYFKLAVNQELQFFDLPVYGVENATRLSLIGLQDKDGFVLGLGIVLSIQKRVLEILTPLADLSKVASLRFGALQLDPNTGEEVY
ncbi:Polyribonucleotide 5'-hydroxyl-kinase Clp1 P-loop domain-containing protein [Candidatus Magnetomoraceae bacterium gMMP-15]